MKNSPVQLLALFGNTKLQRGTVFGGILVIALLAFEVFNYSTTDFALTDLLGANLTFMGLRWATILSIAFCAIDFAGIARLFTPEKRAEDEPAEVWYLFGAWVLAAAMNATLTWWGVAVAINSHTALGSAIVGRDTLMNVVPVFVALMVWMIRILIIGTFAMAGERLFSMADERPVSRSYRPELSQSNARPLPRPEPASLPRPAPRPQPQSVGRPDPTYHPAGMSAKNREESPNPRWRS